MLENDRNWFGSSPDQLGKKKFETTTIISMLSELRTERQDIPKPKRGKFRGKLFEC